MNNENNNTNTSTEAKVDPIVLDLDPIEFPITYGCQIITSSTLCQMINAIFKKVFKDYYGSYIHFNQNNGGLYASLYFAPNVNTTGGISAYIPANQVDKSADIVKRQQAYSNMTRFRRTFDLTWQAKEFLADFVCDYKIPCTNNKNLAKAIKWNEIENEINQPRNGMIQCTEKYCMVSYISIEKLLALVYGTKDPQTNSKIYYNVSPLGYTTSQVGAAASINILIAKLDSKLLDENAKDIGIIASTSGLPIIMA